MLQNIRDRAQGWLAWTIVLLICIPFVLFGIEEYLNTARNVVVAEINGEDVHLQEFERVYQQYRQQVRALFGGNIDTNKLDDNLFRQQAMDQLVDGRLLSQETLASGFHLADKQLAAAIRSIDAFKQGGEFSSTQFEQQLQANGMSPSRFKEQFRLELLNEQLQQGITATTFATRQELSEITRLQDQKRTLEFAILPIDPYKTSTQVTDAEIEKHYKSHQDQYVSQEQVKIAYLELSVDELAKQVVTNDEVVKTYYEEHKSDYTTAEERSASHLLVQVAKDASNDAIEAARKKAEEFAKRAKEGGDFEKLVMEHSDDAGTKSEGGQLGFFGKGVMDPEFEKVAFSMKPGEIAGPVRTAFGFHVIRLNEVKAGHTKTFAEIRDDLEKAYRRGEAERQYFEQAEQLSNLSFENPDTLQPASDALGIKIQESDFFTRAGGTGIAGNSKIIEAAFNPETQEEGANSEPVELEANHVVVFRIQEHKPSEPRKLAEVRQEIVDAVTLDKAKQALTRRGEELLKQIRDGADRKTIGNPNEIKWEEAKDVIRNDTKVNHAVLRAAFKLGRPGEGKPIFDGVSLGTGDYALVALLDDKDPEPVPAEDKTAKEKFSQLNQARGGGEWQDYMANLRDRAEITVSLDKLKTE
jgi:peptidyl-prolyl cis-trans isomerase D